MAEAVKHEIRSTILKWKLSVNNKDKRDELFTNNVFRELDNLMATVYSKYDGTYSNQDCHNIVDVWPMTERTLTKMHESVMRRLRATPTTASPYFGQFSRDVPSEVFDTIREKVLERTSFGLVTVKSTANQVTLEIVDKRKSVYLFNQMNAGGVVIEKRKLLTKSFPDNSYKLFSYNITGQANDVEVQL